MKLKLTLSLFLICTTFAPMSRAQQTIPYSVCNSLGHGGTFTGANALMLIQEMGQKNGFPQSIRFTANGEPNDQLGNCEGPRTFTALIESWTCDDSAIVCTVRCDLEQIRENGQCWP